MVPGGAWSWRCMVPGVHVPGGVHGPRGAWSGGAWSQGVHGPGGCMVLGEWGWGAWSWGGAWSPGGASQHALRQTPPVNRMTNRCKNITLPQTSFPGGNESQYTSQESLRFPKRGAANSLLAAVSSNPNTGYANLDTFLIVLSGHDSMTVNKFVVNCF